jgi:hypothetical protein
MNPVVFFVDHMALKYLVNKLDFSGRLIHWIFFLKEFDYTMQYKLGRMHHQANQLFKISKDLNLVPLEDNFIDANLFITNIVPTLKKFEHSNNVIHVVRK